jgi:hypothetical protein
MYQTFITLQPDYYRDKEKRRRNTQKMKEYEGVQSKTLYLEYIMYFKLPCQC